ncbi:DUF4149 domain-containing protein [Caballeronia telluris]|uniref:Membrane protein n=1 Tax=Caballeronia telluris TaxID=326475 RepID=A0A158HP37_9BURK|nr:DUF4149 domain-containing protein [Caballeronia telluris]SAL46172.1 membrane protein [Caballeronia telluris]
MAHRLFRLVAMVWVGSLLSLGFIAAPVLFRMLERTSAGSVAAQLFRIEGILGVVCGLVLLLIGNRQVKSGFADYKRVRWIVMAMLLCVLIGYFALQPFMESLRVAAQEAGTDLAHSAYAQRFGVLHGVSSAFYVVESLLGILLVWRLPGQSSTGPIVARGQSAAVAARRVRR